MQVLTYHEVNLQVHDAPNHEFRYEAQALLAGIALLIQPLDKVCPLQSRLFRYGPDFSSHRIGYFSAPRSESIPDELRKFSTKRVAKGVGALPTDWRPNLARELTICLSIACQLGNKDHVSTFQTEGGRGGSPRPRHGRKGLILILTYNIDKSPAQTSQILKRKTARHRVFHSFLMAEME